MTWQIGLTAFVFMWFAIAAVLSFDLHLYLTGQPTITSFCRENPWAAWLILSLLGVGVCGLAVHFMD